MRHNLITAAIILAGLGSFGAVAVEGIVTAPSHAECMAQAPFATYNKAADARCDGFLDTWAPSHMVRR